MKQIYKILEEAKYVNQSLKTTVPTKTGALSNDLMDAATNSFLVHTVGVWKEDIIKTHQSFPEDGEVDVEMGIDIVILNREEFEIIKTYIDTHE